MSDLLSSLVSTASALNAFDRVFEVTQNNVANASTPGYVKQRQVLQAMPFDPSAGLCGGVRAGDVQSGRDRYADEAVRRETSLMGQAQQDVNSLTSLQTVFDISGNSGIPKALGDLVNSFSGWAQSPEDGVGRQGVLSAADDLAHAFQQAEQSIAGQAQDSERQIRETVDDINQLTANLRGFNSEVLAGGRQNAALDAEIHSTLEQLAQYGSFTTLEQDDGTVTVLLNGQTPLVVGDQQFAISTIQTQPTEPPPVNASGRAPVAILASDGTDITKATSGAQLGSLLDFHNNLMASYLGDAYQQGDLNRMAQQFADRVNQLLTNGLVSDGPPPQPGVPLFTYDTTDPTNVAASLSLAAGITPDQLAAIDPGPPYVANGVAQTLAGLQTPHAAADEIDGASYIQFYGTLAARTGNALSRANNQLEVQQTAVAQAKNLQQQMSGVSLNEVATIMIQFQRAYEANARLLTILNQLSQETIDMLQP